MDLIRTLDPRSSFAAKVAVALLGVVGLLMAIMLLVVRVETRGQVEFVADQAVERARQAFEESEERRREQLARRTEVFIDSRRTLALLEGAIEAGDIPDQLVGDLVYNLDLAGFEDSTTLTILTDADGTPVVTLLGLAPTTEIDASSVTPLVRQLLNEYVPELTGYRLVNGQLYTVRTVGLGLSGRLIGTASFGLPIQNDDAETLGRVVGAEVCFVAGGSCVAGTPEGRNALASTLADMAGAEGRTMAQHEGDRWELVAERLTAEGPTEGWLAMAVPLEPVLAPFDRIRRSLALGSAGALVVALLLAIFISRGLTQPVRTLVEATRRVGRGEYDTRVPVESGDEMGQLAESFNAMTEGLALKEQYRGVLDKVVSRDVAEELLKDDVRLGGENRDVTILFADIRGFTGLTEGMEPQAVIALLNETMERLSSAVDRVGGVVDKYIGDEIMAVFGAPLTQSDHAVRGVSAGLAMQEAMEEVNRARVERGEAPVQVGIGVHCGEVVAGNMGSAERLNYTVLGDAVNLAARLCSIAGPGELLVSEAVRDQLPERTSAEALGPRELKGFSQAVEVYRVDGSSATLPRVGRSIAGLAGMAALTTALAAGPAPAAAQSLPTLQDLGLEYISPTGAVQLGLSGRLDLEGYAPTGTEPPWIIPDTDPFFAGRARVFGDLFVGSRLFVGTELRVDRGEEPRAGPWDARFDQLFVRVGPVRDLFLQVGKFVSPFGDYPQRHHTTADPFIRPPLNYDYRTMICAGIAPATGADFLAWKRDIPRNFRPIGAPPIWGAPYQWGAMVTGGRDAFTFRVALMNSAPSSEPEAWGWDAERARHPSLVANAGFQVTPALRVSGSYNRGPYLDPEITGLDPRYESWDYLQELFAADFTLAQGRWTVRGEAVADRWEVPNVSYDAWDYSYNLEVQRDLAAGAYLAARVGTIRFNELTASGTGNYAAVQDYHWDYDVTRLQLAGGYRLLRNVGVQAEYMLNHTDDPAGDPLDNLFSVQLWWQY